MSNTAEAIRRQRLGFPKGFGKRVETLINRGQVNPWQALAFAVVVRGCHVDGVEWLDTAAGRWWCEMAGIEPGAMRRGLT